MAETWLIEPLDERHEREAFDCGIESLNEFLHTLAGQYERRRIGRTYVAVQPDELHVCGYYTLACSSLPVQRVSRALARKFPKHAVPTGLIGRLAVDARSKSQGLGETLLLDALRRLIGLSSSLGLALVEVLALDESAKGFYEHYGFVALTDNPLHLVLPIKSAEKLFLNR
jgi:GNAT superfamily N-acetyltransferase